MNLLTNQPPSKSLIPLSYDDGMGLFYFLSTSLYSFAFLKVAAFNHFPGNMCYDILSAYHGIHGNLLKTQIHNEKVIPSKNKSCHQ